MDLLYTTVHMETNNEDQQSNTAPQTTRLIEVLQELETHIKRQNSLKYALLKGMIYGLGTVLGATVLVALLGAIIRITLGPLGYESVLTKMLGQ